MAEFPDESDLQACDAAFHGVYRQINVMLKQRNPQLKTLITVGGWSESYRFSDVASTAESRERFAVSCLRSAFL
jgi:GH18 family chitinase